METPCWIAETNHPYKFSQGSSGLGGNASNQLKFTGFVLPVRSMSPQPFQICANEDKMAGNIWDGKT